MAFATIVDEERKKRAHRFDIGTVDNCPSLARTSDQSGAREDA